jgi:DMSO/TMAO reductase YedYZ molybdopterin-dependent catalytic subunit
MADVTSERQAVPAAPVPAARRSPEPAQVRLAGEVDHPGPVTVAALRELPQHTIELEFVCSRSGLRRHTFTGPLLLDLVMAAGPHFDRLITKDRVRFLLAVTGMDRHTTVLSWGEIDPRYGRTQVLVATWMDGRALDADGPHLAVPGDLAGGRYVSRITTIWTGSADRLTRAHP